MNGYGGFGGCFDDGPDRRNWADKSDAAIRRENQAKKLFDDFLNTVDQETPSYPYSNEVIPAEVHLTSSCYTSFRKYVIAKGCKCVRREITMDEKKKLPNSNRRNCKMYVCKITIPTSPKNLMQAKADIEQKKKQADKRKRVEAERKRKIEQDLVETTKQEHLLAVAHVVGNKENVSNGSPTKRLKVTPITITVPQTRILEYHESILYAERSKIRRNLCSQKESELDQLQKEINQKYEAKKTAELQASQAHFDQVKKVIVDAMISK